MMRLLCVAAMLAWLSVCRGATANDQQILKELEAAWKGQRSEIATAHIRFRLINTGYSSIRPVSPQEFEKLLASIDLEKRPDDLKIIANKLFAKPYQGARPWGDYEFWAEGARTRENQASGGIPTDVHIRDEKAEILTSFINKQVSIYQRNAARVFAYSIDHFRFLPGPELKLQVARHSPSEVDLRAPGWELVVDRATGLVRRRTWRSKSPEFDELRQFGAVQYPGDIVMPAWICNAGFKADRLIHVSFIVIEEAEFNVDLAPDAFALAAPQGTNIFDFREDVKRPRYVHLPQAVKDVLREVDSRTNIAVVVPAARGESITKTRRWFPWASGLLFAFILLLLAARWLFNSQTPLKVKGKGG